MCLMARETLCPKSLAIILRMFIVTLMAGSRSIEGSPRGRRLFDGKTLAMPPPVKKRFLATGRPKKTSSLM